MSWSGRFRDVPDRKNFIYFSLYLGKEKYLENPVTSRHRRVSGADPLKVGPRFALSGLALARTVSGRRSAHSQAIRSDAWRGLARTDRNRRQGVAGDREGSCAPSGLASRGPPPPRRPSRGRPLPAARGPVRHRRRGADRRDPRLERGSRPSTPTPPAPKCYRSELHYRLARHRIHAVLRQGLCSYQQSTGQLSTVGKSLRHHQARTMPASPGHGSGRARGSRKRFRRGMSLETYTAAGRHEPDRRGPLTG